LRSYALIGSGRLARHLRHYLQLLKLPHRTWSRRESNRDYRVLDAVLAESSHVLLAVSDPAVSELARRLSSDQVAVHFSGAMACDKVVGAHPLMTFGERLEERSWYEAIPMVVDRGTRFADVLPGWPNRYYEVDPSTRPYYHALCALAGNSVFLLWQNIADELQKRCGLPREILEPYLHQVVNNMGSRANLTGPVARGDWQRTAQHLRELSDRPDLLNAYANFLRQAKSEGIDVPRELL